MLWKFNCTTIYQFGFTEKTTDNDDSALISTKEENSQEKRAAHSCKGIKAFSSHAQVQKLAEGGDVKQREDEQRAEIKRHEEQLLPAPPSGNLVKLVFNAKGARLTLTNDQWNCIVWVLTLWRPTIMCPYKNDMNNHSAIQNNHEKQKQQLRQWNFYAIFRRRILPLYLILSHSTIDICPRHRGICSPNSIEQIT